MIAAAELPMSGSLTSGSRAPARVAMQAMASTERLRENRMTTPQGNRPLTTVARRCSRRYRLHALRRDFARGDQCAFIHCPDWPATLQLGRAHSNLRGGFRLRTPGNESG